MSFLLVFLDDATQLQLYGGNVGDSLQCRGKLYTRIVAPYDALFYDWLRDKQGQVVGIEIHLFQPDPGWPPRLLNELARYRSGPVSFPQIFFDAHAGGEGRGDEAFGDMYFYESSCGTCLMAVGLDEWISEKDAEALKCRAQSDQ